MHRMCRGVVALVAVAGVLLLLSPSHALTLEDRDELSEFVQGLLLREGFEAEVLCSGTKLLIELVSVSWDGDTGTPIRLLATVTGIGYLLKGVHKVDDGFVLKVDLRSDGYLTTTAGRMEDLARKVKGSRATPKDFAEAFDFHWKTEASGL